MTEVKLILGDCYKKLKEVSDESVDLIIADPPYVVTKEKWDQKDIVTEQLSREFYRVLKDVGSFYCWCGIGEKSQSLIRWFPIFSKDFIFKDLITWKKQRGIGMRRGWLYTREEIMWFVKDNKKFIWNKEEQCGRERRKRDDEKNIIKPSQTGYYAKNLFKRFTNVWDDISEETFNISIKIEHFTPKPTKALERIIKVHTKENDLVLDPFLGSGNTGIICKKLNRNFIGIEIDPMYFEQAKECIDNTTQILL